MKKNRGNSGHVISQPLIVVSQEERSRVTALASTGFRGGELTTTVLL